MSGSENSIHHIIKRDGRLAPYDKSRITTAIFKAFSAEDITDKGLAESRAQEVEDILLETYGHESVPTVEDIQDVVESILIKSGHMNTAKAYIIYRGESFTRPEPINRRLLEESANVEVILKSSVVELKGNHGLTGVVVDQQHNGTQELVLDGLFIEIGADPRVELAQQLGVKLADSGEVAVDKVMHTSVPGVFAAGDLTDATSALKQTITAAAQGAIAAMSAYAYASEHPDACSLHAIAFSLA